MMDKIFSWAEGAVSFESAFLTLIVGLAIAAIFGVLAGQIKKNVYFQLGNSLIFYIIVLILFFALRDQVHEYRLKHIKSAMMSINTKNIRCGHSNPYIGNWRDGIKLIQDCPTEVGYYIKTADILAADRDYESAATLIEFGLDFIQEPNIPLPLCERLQVYYKHLHGKPELAPDCIKVHRR